MTGAFLCKWAIIDCVKEKEENGASEHQTKEKGQIGKKGPPTYQGKMMKIYEDQEVWCWKI